MAHLSLTFFGAFQATLDGQPIPHFRSANIQGLLVYLALQADRAFARDVLITLFWPDEPEKSARANFRQSLYLLRKLLKDDKKKDPADEPPFFLITKQTLQFNPKCSYSLDVTRFAQAMAQSDWAGALKQVNGELLPGFNCESLGFEEWLLLEREHWQQQVQETMSKLAEEQIQQGDFSDAQSTARRLLEREPWRESAHRYLMLALALAGESGEALAQYERCSHALMAELGIPPSPELDTLYDQIESGEISRESASAFLSGGVASPPIPFQAIAIPPHFVGRAEVAAEISAMLTSPTADQSGPRLVALVGMGGIGKTTLAASIAHSLRDHFPDGVLWANTATSPPQDILDLWGRAYGYDFSGLADLESRATAVRSMLADKQTLIVLDNADDAALLRPLLPNGAGCAILLTTRNRELAVALNATVHPVRELSIESGVQLLSQILGEDRVQREAESASTICALLHSLPLAVEIAAQQLKSRARMTLSQMVQRLGDTGRRLGLKISDQAVRTSFEVSWEGLDEELRAFFPLLAVFEGRSFNADALAHVAEMDPFDVEDLLYGLNALSLVKEDESDYFRQHPLLADFAKEKLLEADQAYGRLVDYYLAFVEKNQQNYDLLEPEWGNIGAAIEVGHRLEEWEKVLAFTDVLSQTWLTRARFGGARQAYALAQEAAEAQEDQKQMTRTLLRWGEACIYQSDYDEARHLLTRCLKQSEASNDSDEIAQAYCYLGEIAIDTNQYEEAEIALAKCERIFKNLGNELGLSHAMFRQARVCYDHGPDYDKAELLANEALTIQEAHNDRAALVQTIRLLSQINVEKQQYDSAVAYGQRAVELGDELNDPVELAAAQYLLVQIFRKQSRLDQARDLAQKALNAFCKTGNRRGEALTIRQMSQIHKEDNQLDPAAALAKQSFQILKGLQDDLGCAYALRDLGNIYVKQNHMERARQSWLEAKALAKNINHRVLITSLDELLKSVP